ncbi:LPXTG cell wall anchor domain-containing protein [Enterococcus casseliflavus]|uniref:LPXTG cell wall anchor domain-containing protein n=1 Tax=Enterococcus casseliflavus TaxID=37734 RepID=UPI0034D31E3F
MAVTPEGTHQDVWTSERIDYVVSDTEIVKEVMITVDTGQYLEGTWFYFKEVGFNEAGEEDTAHNFDGSDPDQSLVPRKIKANGVLPKTGETPEIRLLFIEVTLTVFATYVIVKKKRC